MKKAFLDGLHKNFYLAIKTKHQIKQKSTLNKAKNRSKLEKSIFGQIVQKFPFGH